jgi:hypothetical protein
MKAGDRVIVRDEDSVINGKLGTIIRIDHAGVVIQMDEKFTIPNDSESVDLRGKTFTELVIPEIDLKHIERLSS